ncbi:MAG: methionine--tRNA ligase subunit beta [Candidatus Anstonellales archaeon]
MVEVSYGDFAKLELVVGQITEAEKVQGSDKMLKLVVDIGKEKRTVMAGIAKNHHPADLIGLKVAFLANIAPRKIMGVESRGMILAASEDGETAILIVPQRNAKNGARIL